MAFLPSYGECLVSKMTATPGPASGFELPGTCAAEVGAPLCPGSGSLIPIYEFSKSNTIGQLSSFFFLSLQL